MTALHVVAVERVSYLLSSFTFTRHTGLPPPSVSYRASGSQSDKKRKRLTNTSWIVLSLSQMKFSSSSYFLLYALDSVESGQCTVKHLFE